MAISFTVLTKPVRQPRQRVTARGGKGRNYLPSDDPVHRYKEQVADAARLACPEPMQGALTCRLEFVMPRPVSKTRVRSANPRYYHTSTPDADNLAKAVLDACNGILWRDDSQVCTLMVVKEVASGKEPPHLSVWLSELPELG
jgi:Holliday junction resolvase RusA-like endonuclease